MAIIPEDQYPGKTTAGSASYPYGGAQNVTAPGDGTGTPWEAALLNDIFGEQQALLSEAGITPSGSPETALISQYKEAIRTITNMRPTTHNMTSDANYTLTTDQNNKRLVEITDTGVLLSTGRDITVDTVQKRFFAKNDTLQTLTFKTSSGTGIAVLPGVAIELYNDGTNVIILSQEIGVNQTWQNVTGSRASGVVYTNTTGRPIYINVSQNAVGVQTLILTVGGVLADSDLGNGTALQVSGIVPNGATYVISGATGILYVWSELR